MTRVSEPRTIVETVSLIRSAEIRGDDLVLVLVGDILVVPDQPEPALELLLCGCKDMASVEAASVQLQGMMVWGVEAEDTGKGHTVTFEGDWSSPFLSIHCQSIELKRRGFGDAEWRALAQAYDWHLKREQAERQRLEQVIRALKLAIQQRKDRASRIAQEQNDHPQSAQRATGRLQVLEEIERVMQDAFQKPPSST